MSSTQDAAETQKTLGNEEFNQKNFDKAVEYYSEAIRLDPDNYVYYSNRSAAYGALGKWELAEQDARECVNHNCKFAKGYHRLANAQQQLGRKKAALDTLKTALRSAVEPEKVPGLKKLLRQLTQELAPESNVSTQGGSHQVPAHIAKELQELQPQYQKIQREFEQIEARLAAFTRQKKRLALVGREVVDLPEHTHTYRSIGKMFVQTNREENVMSIKSEEKQVAEQISSLETRKNYLTRQKQTVQDNITELLARCT